MIIVNAKIIQERAVKRVVSNEGLSKTRASSDHQGFVGIDIRRRFMRME